MKFILRMPDDYPRPSPGQFVRVKCDGVLLPRPISLCWWDLGIGDDHRICLVIEAKGPGTSWLRSKTFGDYLDVSAPIGNGFKIKVTPTSRYLLVGGGIGVPPILSAKRAAMKNTDQILCFTTKEKIILEKEFGEDYYGEVIVATDDGSYGLYGRADKILHDYLSGEHPDYDAILTCGPKPMIAAVAKIAKEFNIPCQASLEEYMACGVGACKGCAVQLKSGMGTVCKDGPVFDAEEVVWDV